MQIVLLQIERHFMFVKKRSVRSRENQYILPFTSIINTLQFYLLSKNFKFFFFSKSLCEGIILQLMCGWINRVKSEEQWSQINQEKGWFLFYQGWFQHIVYKALVTVLGKYRVMSSHPNMIFLENLPILNDKNYDNWCK